MSRVRRIADVAIPLDALPAVDVGPGDLVEPRAGERTEWTALEAIARRYVA